MQANSDLLIFKFGFTFPRTKRSTKIENFAIANNSHTQISHPKRLRLNEFSDSNKKKREITFRLSLVELREEDSNLRPPGYEPGKLTSCSTPRCIFTLSGSFRFAGAKVRQILIKTKFTHKFILLSMPQLCILLAKKAISTPQK